MKLTIRRRLAAALLPLLLPLAGCGGDEEPPVVQEAPAGGYDTYSGGPPGGMVAVLADREPDDLNPLTYDSWPASQAVHLMFRSLARRDTTLSGYQPDLARSWELEDDSTLVLRLREDVAWHDGVPVTAEDVVFTIRRQKNPLTTSPRQTDVAAVESVTARDSFTVAVELSEAGPYTINSVLEVIPVPKHILEDVPPAELRTSGFGRDPVGNGFYRFGRWDAGQQLVLETNPEFPEGRPALDRVVMRFVPDLNAAMTELLIGQGDLLTKVPPEQVEQFEAAENVELYAAPRVRPAWIAWNTLRAPLDDVRVRRALLMGVDREAIVGGLLGDVTEPAYSPIPDALREHSPEVEPVPYDPAAARRLLGEAGWRDVDGDGIREKDGRPLRLEVDYTTSDQIRADVLVAMQSMLREIGVELVPRAYESTAWVDRLRNREFTGSFWGWGWGPGVAGPNAAMVFHSRSIPPGGANFASYADPEVDRLLDRALEERDTAEARRIWRELEQRLIDDAVYAPIYLDPELYAMHERFQNVRFRGIEWWEDVPYWYIPLEERLPRDRGSEGR